jgi:anti-sigma B factor antagonist
MRDGALTIERVVDSGKGYEKMTLEGPLTLSTLFELQESLRKDPAPKTIIDLSGVPYIDSAGLGALLSFHASCKRTGREYALAGMAARVYTMFAASKVDKLVNLYPTLREAEAFLAK